MASKTIQVDKIGLAAVKPLSDQFFKLGQTEAMLAIQKELLEAYAQVNSAWLARVQDGGRLVVRIGGHKADGHPLRPRSFRCLSRMRRAADANGC